LLPEGEDPDSFIRKNGKAAFLESVQRSKGLVNFAIDRVIDRITRADRVISIDVKVKAAEECFAIIRKINNRIEQDYYLNYVSKGLGIEKDVLVSELKRGREGKKSIPAEKTRSVVKDRPKAEDILLTLMIRDSGLRRMAEDTLDIGDFTDPQFKEVAGYLLKSDKEVHAIVNSESCNQVIKDVMTKMAVSDAHFDSPEKTFSDCIRVLQRTRLERELKQVEHEIATAELGNMVEKVKGLLKTKQVLMQKRKVLYEN
jgi:DNA primase